MKKRTCFRHLTEHDRDRIHALWGNGHNQKGVAEVLGVSPVTERYPANCHDTGAPHGAIVPRAHKLTPIPKDS